VLGEYSYTKGGSNRKLYHEIYNLYSLPNIVSIVAYEGFVWLTVPISGLDGSIH
jgi:hypothetical protein